MPRRGVPCAFGLCPWVRAWPCFHMTVGIHFPNCCTPLMTDTPPMREQERDRAEPEPGAQPRSIGPSTAGHSHRLTSGGEAVIYDVFAFDSRPAAQESSMLLP